MSSPKEHPTGIACGRYSLTVLPTITRQYRALILEDGAPLVYQDEVSRSRALWAGISMMAVLTRRSVEELTALMGITPR